MKKLIAILICATVLLSMLAGCRGELDPSDEIGIPEGLNGIDASKLILANERLNSALFKNTDSIFGEGATAFSNLYDIAEENMVKYAEANKVELISRTRPALLAPDGFEADTSYELSGGGKLDIDGNLYRWSDFGEYSNSYEYFLNITNNVKTSAEIGARLIDDTKKYVRIVDTWVNIGGPEYYLHVEDDEEIIYSRLSLQLEICRRYKRADGVNVYELYTATESGGSMRMTYIPGEKFEYSYIYNTFDHNFCAVNTKGYWEVVDVGQTDESYNVSLMVLKDDICYDSFYSPEMGNTNMVKVISADKKTDILDIAIYEGSGSVTLKLQSFTGVDYIELLADNVIELGVEESIRGNNVYRYETPQRVDMPSEIVYSPAVSVCTLGLSGGMVLNYGDKLLDDKITVGGIGVSFNTMENQKTVYVGAVNLQIEGNGYDEIFDNLEEFLRITGLKCTRDLSAVRSGIARAFTELEQMNKHHTWNESPIATKESLDIGYSNNLAKHEAFKKMLDAIKNAEVIDFENKEVAELRIKFAPITSQNAISVTNDGLTVNVSGLELSVEDTLLFVVGERYTVNFAIALAKNGTASDLTHIELSEAITVEYTDTDGFTVTQTASFEIPILKEGEYTLVAYISTEDGIRSSEYQPVRFTQIKPFEHTGGSARIALGSGSNEAMSIVISATSDIQVALNNNGSALTYSDIYAVLEREAYLYGCVSDGAALEFSSDGEVFTTVKDTEGSLADGIYRLKYSNKNGDAITEGYVYTTYTADQTE